MAPLVNNITNEVLALPNKEGQIPFKSKYFPYKRDNNSDKYFSLDLHAFKCKPLQVEGPLQYVMSFSPPVCYKNMLFGDIALNRVEDDKVCARIKPKEYVYLYDYIYQEPDPKNKRQAVSSKYRWILKKSRSTQVMTQAGYLHNVSQEVAFHSPSYLNKGSSTPYDTDAVQVRFESNDFEIRNNEHDNFKLRELAFSSQLSKKIQIYSPYVIVNKTNLQLIVGCGKKKNDLEAYPQTVEYFNPQAETKLYIKSDEYSWSTHFDFNTIGVAGQLSLERTSTKTSYKPVIKEYNSNEVDIGVKISTLSKNFYKTVAITFTPRFVLANSCAQPIALVKDHKESTVQHLLESGQEKVYYYENKTDKNNCIRIRNLMNHEINKKLLDKLADIKPEEWSSRFEIGDICDFQVELTCKEEQKDEPKKWYQPSKENGYKRFIRVVITTKDDATLFVTFSDPYKPECMIKNATNEPIFIKQKSVGAKKEVPPSSSIPFCWSDLSASSQKVLNFYTDTNKRSFKIDDIKYLGSIQSSKSKYAIEVKAKKSFKQVEIKSKYIVADTKGTEKASTFKLLLTQKMITKCLLVTLDLQGIGVSIIDSDPKEVLFLVVHKPVLNYVRKTAFTNTETEENIDLTVDHMQIDNMASMQNPVILSPRKILRKEEAKKEEVKKAGEEEEYTPFIQIKIDRQLLYQHNTVHVRYPCLMFAVQEIQVQLETSSLNDIMNIINKITTVFSVLEDEYLSANAVKQKKFDSIEEAKGELVCYKVSEVCPSINTDPPSIINESNLQTERQYFEFVNIGAIKILLTFKFEHKNLDINIKKGFGVFSLGYTLFSNVANMSDSPLKFKELILTNTYAPPSSLIDMIVKNFTRQGIFQFYKLIGSSDLLGNPVGFVDKLGSGVYEFFNEPKKGLIKGPREFVGGVGKGVTSLVGGVTSASLDSVSKITGSLYNVTKDISGQQIEAQYTPTGFADGIFEGAKGGLKELSTGITGLATNPYEHAKKGGIGGFFKGIGKGLAGAMATPVTATLKIATSVTAGLNSTSITLTQGKIEKQGRFRHPRYISPTGIIHEYDEALAEAQLIVFNIKGGKYSDETIRFLAKYYKYTKGIKEIEGVFIITDKHVLYIKNLDKMLFVCKVTSIVDVQTDTEGMDVKTGNSIHHLSIKTDKKESRSFSSDKHYDIAKAAEILRS